MRATQLFACILLLLLPMAVKARQATPSSDEIVKQIIEESIASYSGSCPCPYNSARNGSSCGRRSAYSRPGGWAPKCYARDVTAEDIASYRKRLEQN